MAGLRVPYGPEPDLPVPVFEAGQLLAGVQAEEDRYRLWLRPLVSEPGITPGASVWNKLWLLKKSLCTINFISW